MCFIIRYLNMKFLLLCEVDIILKMEKSRRSRVMSELVQISYLLLTGAVNTKSGGFVIKTVYLIRRDGGMILIEVVQNDLMHH